MKTTFKLSQSHYTLLLPFLLCLALLLVSGCGNDSGGSLDSLVVDSAFAQTRGAAGVQWEYKIVKPTGQTENAREGEFNRLGLEGWEFAAFNAMNGWHYFKRPKR